MDQAIVFMKSTTGKLLPVVLLLAFTLWGCEKKPKTTLHTDVLEAEINGTKYTFEDLSHAGSISQYFTIEGEHNVNNEVYTYITISACNLIEWPSKSVFPLVAQFCSFFNSEGYTQIYISDRKTSTRTIYITQDSIPNPNSTITFEKFDVIDGNNFEIKGTFKMALARVAGPNPLSSPDSCFVTGRIHIKRPRRSTVD